MYGILILASITILETIGSMILFTGILLAPMPAN